ncbi:MAG TPA: MYXO-CTERM sorting domain-containing protein [Polyangia bacterium]|nr:MYXO-CTERM sorting domain-containing protein [Polyangia bacterium]
MSASLLAGLLTLLGAPSAGRAEQFVLFDVTFTFTQANAVNATPSKSHFYVRSQMNPSRPKDWTAPIDYRNGTVHIRTDVIDKPAGSVATGWTLCYIPYKGIGSGYGCTGTGAYTEKGVFDRDVTMTSWWQNQDIVWSQGIQGMDLVLKDDKGVFSHLRPDPEHFFPTKMRITMIQVSAGAKYDPSKVPNIDPVVGGDGGAAPDGGASDVDMGTPEDAGATGSGGSGATGTGGAGTGEPTGSGGAIGTGGGSVSSGGSGGSASGSGGAGGPGISPGEPATGGCTVAARDRAPAALGLMAALGFVALVIIRRRRR